MLKWGKGIQIIEDPQLSYSSEQGEMLKRKGKVFGSRKQRLWCISPLDVSSQDIVKGRS